MAGAFLQSSLPLHERRKDFLTEAIINSAIDMEATLGSVYAIVFMRRQHIGMELALRVVLKQAERRNALAWLAPEPEKIDVCFTASKFEQDNRSDSNASVWHHK
jgi:hypothetical protein